MRSACAAIVAIAFLVGPGLAGDTSAAGKKLKQPPAPLNAGVKFEEYQNTDIAMVSYLTSRQEFRVGHPPYRADRFHVAELVLIAEHTRKYLRPDLKAEIKLAPQRSKPELMANKVFQEKWKGLLSGYEKLLATFNQVKFPPACKKAFESYRAALEDEIFLARKVGERMFVSQQTRAHELLREDLRSRFRSRDTNWFDRLCDEFEQDGNLEKFYPSFVDLLIDPGLQKAKEQAEKAMQAVGVEYATAAKEEAEREFVE